MTARRPPRISDYNNETQLADSDSAPENDSQIRSSLSSPLTGSPIKVLSPHSTAVHPLLTDFGPASATQYFREALEKLKMESINKGKQKQRATSPARNQTRRGIRRNTRKSHCTLFDGDDSEDDYDDIFATRGDENIFTTSYGLDRFRVDVQSEDEDANSSMFRMRGRRQLQPSTSSGNVYGDLFGRPLNQPTPILSARAPDFAPLQVLDPNAFPALGSTPPLTPLSTIRSRLSQLSNIPAAPRSTEEGEILPSIEDPPRNDVPASGNAGCHCKIQCCCGTYETHENQHVESLSRPTTQLTRSHPSKSRLGKPHRSPSKNRQLAIPSVRSAAAASDSTEVSATSRRWRPNRSRDFEEHASEKRKSWRAGGENDISDDDSELSEAGSLSYFPASTSGRLHRLPPQSQSRSAAPGNLVGNNHLQPEVAQPQYITRSMRQSIAQALDSIEDDISAGLFEGGSTRAPALRSASTGYQEQAKAQALSTYRDEETLLGASLLFEESEEEDDADFHNSRRRRRISRSLLRSPPRRRAMRGLQRSNTVVGTDNIVGNPFLPRRVPSSAIWSSIAQRPSIRTSSASTRFDYDTLAPQLLPKDIFARHSHSEYHTWKQQKTTLRSTEAMIIQNNNMSSRANKADDANSTIANVTDDLPLYDRELQYPRKTWDVSPLQASPNEPPVCPLGQDGRGWPNDLPVDIFILITRYLSHQDVCNLRLVNSTFESILVPVIFRSVVTKFGRSMFDVNLGRWEKKPPEGSIFQKYGMEIHKFGISFEIDLEGLRTASPKVIQKTQSSWWGKYDWPVPKYPRFKSLEVLENLADHLPLLRGAFKDLTNVSELALCVDSGHGWLNGPDVSDLAVWNLRCSKGCKVFGKTFQAEDKWHQYGRNEIFKWAQINTINEALKSLTYDSHMEQWMPESQFLKSVAIRDFDSYVVQSEQSDVDPDRHTGGTVPPTSPNAAVPNWAWQAPVPTLNHMNIVPNPMHVHLITRATHRGPYGNFTRQNPRNRIKKGEVIQPQWPVIYNGHNLSAETGGHCSFVQNKLADPRTFPVQPGQLTEAQAQWLMETVWAQRAFLSAYTTAILTNKANFKQVHSLHIAKISSGLLPSLEQRELWQALPNLRTLKVLVSPDWRTEYIPGDQSFQTNMLISPVQASIKFADFLHRYVSRIEHLSTLTIGFIGGGERATGLLARNQHILPAPITFDPRSWLTDHVTKPDLNTMISFNHIKNLIIENSWLSPFMLESFMAKSKDTSLRHLTLDSVSLTTANSQRTNTPMTTLEDGLKPEYAPASWLQEHLPSEYCWPAVIDRLTPGVTFSQLKYDTGLIDPIQVPPPEPSFRGNVEKLTFKSCGYVKISGVPQTEFNQNGLVMPNTNPRDHGLNAREGVLREARGLGEMCGNATATVMMREKDPQGHEWFGLGRLTQCIHPVEKRVLEEAWQMRFGWGDDMERFGAVEDGCFEGGTGRFSGEVTK